MNRRKDNGNFFIKIVKSIRHGFDGIKYAIEYEHNSMIMMVGSIVLFILGILFRISILELVGLLITIGMTFLADAFNSSIEALGDSITLEDHPLVKIAKDCGTTAVMTSIFIELVVAGVIFIPKIIALF